MDDNETPQDDRVFEATKRLKKATARARHALHQFRRYPTSPACVKYLDEAKKALALEYTKFGAVIAEEHLV